MTTLSRYKVQIRNLEMKLEEGELNWVAFWGELERVNQHFEQLGGVNKLA